MIKTWSVPNATTLRNWLAIILPDWTHQVLKGLQMQLYWMLLAMIRLRIEGAMYPVAMAKKSGSNK
jgi:hypothetical protein